MTVGLRRPDWQHRFDQLLFFNCHMFPGARASCPHSYALNSALTRFAFICRELDEVRLNIFRPFAGTVASTGPPVIDSSCRAEYTVSSSNSAEITLPTHRKAARTRPKTKFKGRLGDVGSCAATGASAIETFVIFWRSSSSAMR